jgi:hypothetical protein
MGGKSVILINDEIMQAIGLEKIYMIHKEKRYEIVLKKISRDIVEVIAKKRITAIRTGDMVRLIPVIDGKSSFFTVRIESISYLQDYLFFEAVIVGTISEKIEMILDTYDKETDKKRKEQRVIISEESTMLFRMSQRFTLVNNKTEYPAYVKNISNTAINFVTVRNIPHEVHEMVGFELHFDEPDETIPVRGTVLRKQVFESDGAELVNLVVAIEQNEPLRKRIEYYFKVVHALVRPFLIGRV